LFEAKRKVQKDRTVSLNGMLYEVDASLVGETVTLRYDPSDQGDVVEVCHKDYFPLEAKKVDVYANCFVKRDRPSGSIQTAGEKKRAEATDDPQPKIRQPIDFTKLANTKREGEDV
jgi:putative transposase